MPIHWDENREVEKETKGLDAFIRLIAYAVHARESGICPVCHTLWNTHSVDELEMCRVSKAS